MRVAVLYSGGKDSTFALSWAVQQGWDACCLVSMQSLNPASYMFHTPNIFLTQLQSECLGIPLLLVPTTGEKEEELADLKAALAQAQYLYGVDTVVTGAVASDYQEERVNRVCQEIGLRTFSPLWHKNQEQLVLEMINSRFVFKISAVAAQGLGEEFLGADVDLALLETFKELHARIGFHIAGEGGEYETLVLDCPLFHKRLIIDEAEKHMDGQWNGVWMVKKAHVENKPPFKNFEQVVYPSIESDHQQ